MENIKIIHQTDNYLVINKPAGISVHKDGKGREETLADWLLKNFPQTKTPRFRRGVSFNSKI